MFPLRFSFDPIEERIYQPSLSAEPPGKTSQRGQAPIVGGGCEGFLAHEKGLDRVSREPSDRHLATLCEQWRQVFRVTFAGVLRKRGDLKELLKCLC